MSITDRPNTSEHAQFAEACAMVIRHQKASTAWLQRQLRIGYNSAARLIERMEAAGTVSTPNQVGARTVLISAVDALPPVECDHEDSEGSDAVPNNKREIAERPASDGNVAADQLRLLIERIERLEEEKKGISDDIKDVYLEAKATGYDTKAMRDVVRLRKLETHVRREQADVLETYKNALGLE